MFTELVRHVDALYRGKINDIFSNDQGCNTYRTHFNKKISYKENIFVSIEQNCTTVLPDTLFSALTTWDPKHFVFSKKSKALRHAAKNVSRKVGRNNTFLVNVNATHSILYGPPDLHEALVSAYVRHFLYAQTPFFPGSIQSVQLINPTSHDKLDARLSFTQLFDTRPACRVAAKREYDRKSTSLRSEIALVAIALHLAQNAIHLKHLDLHSENVMWRDPPVGVDRFVIENFFQQGVHLGIPLASYGSVPAIIDFGLSSAAIAYAEDKSSVQLLRCDYHLLESYQNFKAWGNYDPFLVGDEGYDLFTLIESLMRDLQEMRPIPLRCLKVLDQAQEILGAATVSRKNGRPLTRVPMSMKTFVEVFCKEWRINTSDIVSTDKVLVLPKLNDLFIAMQEKSLNNNKDAALASSPSTTVSESASDEDSLSDSDLSTKSDEDSSSDSDSSTESDEDSSSMMS
jgi:hypothetical protein